MRIRLSCLATLALFCLCTGSIPAHAGQLFPPKNLSNSQQNCPNGQVLSWNGNDGCVECNDPSPGVTVARCPSGQELVGITNGQPICESDEVLSGTWCGMAAVQSYSCLGGETCDQNYPGIWVNGVIPPQGGTVVQCQGHNPAVDCPTGYSQLVFDTLAWNGPAQHAANVVAACIKN